MKRLRTVYDQGSFRIVDICKSVLRRNRLLLCTKDPDSTVNNWASGGRHMSIRASRYLRSQDQQPSDGSRIGISARRASTSDQRVTTNSGVRTGFFSLDSSCAGHAFCIHRLRPAVTRRRAPKLRRFAHARRSGRLTNSIFNRVIVFRFENGL